jgi:hypothetical protein
LKANIYVICCFAIFSSASYGEIYKWVDENGRQQFSNIKPSDKAAGDIQEVKVKEGSFVEQDKAQLERTKEFVDSQQAKREQDKKDRQAAYEKSKPFAPTMATGQSEADRARLRDARNVMRDSPLGAPRARQAPRARSGY